MLQGIDIEVEEEVKLNRTFAVMLELNNFNILVKLVLGCFGFNLYLHFFVCDSGLGHALVNKPVHWPRMPDGTRGFSFGRGKPEAKST